jgi:2-C-methyl-D-erythritol 4-phosphate cytidylyltransferase
VTTPRDVQAGWYAWRTAQDWDDSDVHLAAKVAEEAGEVLGATLKMSQHGRAAYVILHHGNRPWVHPARMPMSAGCLDAARICGGLTTIVPMRRSSEVAQAARVTA